MSPTNGAEQNQAEPRRHRQWLHSSNPNYLLNLFTILLVTSALIIMSVVGTAIYRIYSSAMVKNAEATAISVVKLIMSAEIDNLLREGSDGWLKLKPDPVDLVRLDAQMHRYLKPFAMYKINIYSPDKRLVYSTDAASIGTYETDNDDLNSVLRGGKAFSALERSNARDVADGRLPGVTSIVEAYAPIFDSRGRILGVFEVYVDITSTWTAIYNVLFWTMAALGLVLTVCLFSLYVPMKRGTLNLIKAHRELTELASRDDLTGTYNRRYINERIKGEFQRMRRQVRKKSDAESIALIMVDIDHFKSVNDTYGHAVGDEVLREVARRLKKELRDYDVLCRYGGEEFLIMLPLTDQLHANTAAERLRQIVFTTAVDVTSAGPIPITVSIGVTTSTADEESEDTAIDRADRALYQAKAEGRNAVVFIA